MGSIVIKEQTAPATPATDYHTVYVDSADGVLKKKNDAGTVSSLEPPVTSVFGRTGAVTAQSGDYTPVQVGADASGAAAAAQAFAIQRANHTGSQLAATVSDFTAAAKAAAVSDAIVDAVTDVAPSQNAVFDALAGKQASLGFTAENVANKDTDVNLAADSDTLYPSQKAVKAYVDASVPSGAADRVARFDTSGDLTDISQLAINDDGFTIGSYTAEPNDIAGSFDVYRANVNITPLQNSEDETWILSQNQISIDPSSSGFDFGTTGTAFRFVINNIVHNGTGDMGGIEFIQNNLGLGNGTDPIDVKGFGYAFGFGNVNANVNISGPMQGYGFQPSINASATISSTTFTQIFYDNANVACPSPNWTTFNSGPNIASIQNNNNFTGMSVNPTIPTFTGNAGFTGVNIGGNLGTFNTNGYYHGVSVNPTITSARYAAGINVTMDNVTLYSGVVASLVIQDLTIATDLPSSFGNTATIEYTGGGTAGAEVVSQLGLAFSVQIESGVSTATQIAAALNGFVGFTQNFNVTISGVGGNAQVTQAATNLAGGEDPGRKQAAFLDGDVEITGSLTFGGALSIGQLNSFFTQAMVDSGGNPTSGHGMITAPTVADNVTLTTADYLGVNTAMLLTIGDNATVGTAFVGISALGLPAVIKMGSGSTVDQVAGATFAVSLDATAGGGTIDRLDLCRSIAIPNGVTAITNLRGYKFDLPFGDPGTTSWGFYEAPGTNNYFAGNLLIGGTAGSDDTVTNSSVALEIKSVTRAAVLSRMTTTERNSLTAIDGMTIYNTTDDKFQGYANGSWVDFH